MQQLHLREEHLIVIANAREREFRLRLADYVRQMYPSALQHVSEEELQRRVDIGIRRARKHLLSTERAVAGFVALMFLLGPRFDDNSKVKRALNNFARKDYDRLPALSRKLKESDWQAVLRKAKAISWNALS